MARTRELCIFSHSTFSKTNTDGIGTKCTTKSSFSLAENQIKGVKKCRDQVQVSVLSSCPS